MDYFAKTLPGWLATVVRSVISISVLLALLDYDTKNPYNKERCCPQVTVCCHAIVSHGTMLLCSNSSTKEDGIKDRTQR